MEPRIWRGPAEWARARARAPGDEAAPTPEFPAGADRPPEITRRGLLQLVGATAAVAGAAGCSRGPAEFIVPYVDQPPEVVPGVPTRYATTMTLGGYGVGMIVESHEGRPTKAEGNPRHPASLGALGTIEQAAVHALYDPARLRELTHAGEPADWDAFARAFARGPTPGKAVHVLMEPTGSPHLADLVARVRSRIDAVVHFGTPATRSNVWDGARLAFGRVLEPLWNFAKADVVVALDADFLQATASPMAWAMGWAERRRLKSAADAMSRLYVVEARLTVTGMSADDRLAVRAREVRAVAAALAAELVKLQGGADVPDAARSAAAARPLASAWVRAVARDLRAHAGSSLVLAGDAQPPEVHALAHAMNELLGNAGATVTYAPSPIFEAGEESHDPAALPRAIDRDEVGALLILGGDPAYTMPADVGLAAKLSRVPAVAYLTTRLTATARHADWVLPEAHFLEAWGDARAFDGTVSIAQPLVRPLVDGKTAGQVLAALLEGPFTTSRALVERYWRANAPGDFEGFWRNALVHGVADVAPPPAVARPRVDWGPIAAELRAPPAPPAALEIVYFLDPKVHDGRFADQPILQELGDPVTKLTWGNAALVGPGTAAREELETSDLVELAVGDRRVQAPVMVLPGVADGVVAIALGYGQDAPGRVSSGVGADAYRLRGSRALWADDGRIRKVSGSGSLALIQEHWSMEGRPIVLRRTLDEYRRDPGFAEKTDRVPLTLFELRPPAPRQWGMTIDLNACTGCSACVVACSTENNVPMVGKVGVASGREMHWIRIDRYFVGPPESAAVVVQPMLCQHCEKAPCEYVCPVNATVHSSDGLNEMVYNRCVGTRFCSNNCPYKVRRFNFFNYNVGMPASAQLGMNPDVTVRARGVMEKCSYCVQRIREAEIRARREERPLRDGEVVTACQQTCPTGAIVFGDIADPASRVSESRRNERLYQVLNDLGTLPRTRYLARIANPNPEIAT